ncbi:MAG TPA: alpha amylase C-terminal domain-containing protein, partial [Polyangiaceae bacterium]|nr:alpha amylase C-terminal domain-containing protein [Polyangiaceae bacterium]
FHFGDGTALCRDDPWLEPYKERLRERQRHFLTRFGEVERAGGLLGDMSQGHRYFGFNRGQHEGRPGIWYREWAPAAQQLWLVGDFNGWDTRAHPLARDRYGVWSVFLPATGAGARLAHESRVKVRVASALGESDRIPAYIRRTIQDPTTHDFTGQYWDPPEPYAFRHPSPRLPRSSRIYEAHVGMAPEEGKLGNFREFTRDVLPRIAELGYNTVQLMAIMEHPYYGSFGYHVSSFFGVSSRFGTPEELKALIDQAHALGLRVLIDLVHSHAVRNTREGLNQLDGTDYQYFHAPPRGVHVAWDSLVFDYAKPEVLRFLLSNVRYWLEEFRFDGFRFDGITSMLYLDHGLGHGFSSYDDYFSPNVDEDTVAYLKLANALVHALSPEAITIAEDVSGMPGMARPVDEGGLGFDYRLAMGIPDYWIKIIKERKDEDWQLGELYNTMLHRRRNEKHVAYAESHDQALVGDQTLAFRLMGAEMYWNMAKGRESPIIDRGIALHKLIRLFTFSLGGEAWLNFMGNEFGHPEWVDFPREGNQWSYHYARRQWSLADNPELRYHGLLEFDRALQQLDERFGLLADTLIEQLALHEDTKQIVYRRGPLVFAFNFHPHSSYDGLRIPVPDPYDYRPVLDTDARRFEGFGRTGEDVSFPVQTVPMYGRPTSIQIYLPSRSALVLAPVAG